ncbi:hypothetical protein P7K49_034076 [Saguinus oedipus]|uniref:Uncharacterized protein n=1 Tax=Saguinus oedipus TaxID=9490 RepID=A0ABQ9TTQ4_SAGOE|nr:hypothetical protein P7K49_034076 [Saguinus oedipus]
MEQGIREEPQCFLQRESPTRELSYRRPVGQTHEMARPEERWSAGLKEVDVSGSSVPLWTEQAHPYPSLGSQAPGTNIMDYTPDQEGQLTTHSKALFTMVLILGCSDSEAMESWTG